MNSFYEHSCKEVGTGDLLLFAYGEADDAGVREHVKTCGACRAYLESIAKVRALAQEAGDSASEDTVASVREAAEAKRSRGFADIIAGMFSRPRVLVPLAAALLLAITLIAYQASRHTGAPAGEAGQANEMPDYIAGVSSQLSELEQMMNLQEALMLGGDTAGEGEEIYRAANTSSTDRDGDAASTRDEVLDYVFVESSEVESIEVSMNELEYEMGLKESYKSGPGVSQGY